MVPDTVTETILPFGGHRVAGLAETLTVGGVVSDACADACVGNITLKPTEAVDATNALAPVKLALSVLRPAACGVIWQVAIPFASVTPVHDWLPRVIVIVSPGIPATGLADMSVSDAVSVAG